jgi:hypothetical protein
MLNEHTTDHDDVETVDIADDLHAYPGVVSFAYLANLGRGNFSTLS